MPKFEFDETTLKNLSVFLSRTKLEGSEVQEFNKIIYALSNPIPDSPVATVKGDEQQNEKH